MRVERTILPLCTEAGGKKALEMIYGDRFRVLQHKGHHVFGQRVFDGYVGYASFEGLGEVHADTHWVTALATHRYQEPDLKSPARSGPSFGATLGVECEVNGYLKSYEGDFVPSQHLRPLDQRFDDHVSVAERFIGAPYLWGGDSCWGIDCSGLVQLSFRGIGRICHRDSDLQRNSIGRKLTEGEAPRRGDFAFWKGHVGMMVDELTLLHATAHDMAVVKEPFVRVKRRIAAISDTPFHGFYRCSRAVAGKTRKRVAQV